MVAVLERPSISGGAQVPRIRIVPEGVDHPRWEEIEEFVRKIGIDLDPWQWDVLRVSLMRVERDESVTFDNVTYTDQWAAMTIGVCAPRQNGKNVILEARELVGCELLGERNAIHSAHLADTAHEQFRSLDHYRDVHDWLDERIQAVRYANGKEAIEFKNGSRIRFRTRTRGGGRGWRASPVVFDESMYLPEVSIAAIMPVVSAQPDPQIWYTGSAVDQMWHEDGFAFTRIRERAMGGESQRLAWFEWSLPYDTPDEVPDDLDVMSAVAQTNPAFGTRITPDYILTEYEDMPRRTFYVERCGVGDWPDLTLTSSAVFNLERWNSLIDERSVAVAPLVFAFDVQPSRDFASIAVAGFRKDGSVHIEVTDHREGTGWVPGRLVELQKRHDPAGIYCDSVGPAAAVMSQVMAEGVFVETLSTQELGQACGRIFDAVEQGRVRHLNQTPLNSAIKGAAKRPLGDAWAWSRKNSTVDITPLVSCTVALYALEQSGGTWVGL